MNLGKDRTKQMIESFGGSCVSALSGKVDYLLCGKDPGYTGYVKAANAGKVVINLQQLTDAIINDSFRNNKIETTHIGALLQVEGGYDKTQIATSSASASPSTVATSSKTTKSKTSKTKAIDKDHI